MAVQTNPWSALLARANNAAGQLARLTDEQAAAVTNAVGALTGVHQTLSAMEQALDGLPEVERAYWRPVVSTLAQRYYVLALPVYRNADEVGAAPLLIVGGLALSGVACAWALVAYEYVRDLQAQTALAATELQARVDAMNAGKNLPVSTLTPKGDGLSGKHIALGALGLGFLGAGFFAFRRAA